MKIINWNCAGAFRKKYQLLDRLGWDLLIIQECENPETSADKYYKEWASNYQWIGDSKHKGLGVFAKDDIQLKRLEWSDSYEDSTVKHFLPCLVEGNLKLLAVWAHRNNSPTFGYIGQFWKYLQINIGKFGDNILIAGDFNSNVIWDRWDRWWNHSDVTKQLNDIEVFSLYHSRTGEAAGKETTPTFYLQKNRKKPYHIDYFFASKSLIERTNTFEILNSKSWLTHSDHCPMIFEFS